MRRAANVAKAAAETAKRDIEQRHLPSFAMWLESEYSDDNPYRLSIHFQNFGGVVTNIKMTVPAINGAFQGLSDDGRAVFEEALNSALPFKAGYDVLANISPAQIQLNQREGGDGQIPWVFDETFREPQELNASYKSTVTYTHLGKQYEQDCYFRLETALNQHIDVRG